MFETTESPKTRLRDYLWITGFLYGLLLTAIGFLAAGAGHGTYVLIGIFSSPFGLLGLPIAFLGTILLWSFIGLIAGKLNNSPHRKLFLLVMAIHYGGMFLVLSMEAFGDWNYAAKASEKNSDLLILGSIIYAIGQIILWFLFLVGRNESEAQTSN